MPRSTSKSRFTGPQRRPPRADTGLTWAEVVAIGLAWPGVTVDTKYDGTPVLKLHGCFLAGLASHEAAEPDTLIVRTDAATREALLAEVPDTYYITERFARHDVVLVRLSRVNRDVVRDLVGVSRRLALPHASPSRRTQRGGNGVRSASRPSSS